MSEKPDLFLVVVPDKFVPRFEYSTALEQAQIFRRLVPHIKVLPVCILGRSKQVSKKLLNCGDNKKIFQRLSQVTPTGLWWRGTMVGRQNERSLVACPAHTTEPGYLMAIITEGKFTPCIVVVKNSDKKAMEDAARAEGMSIVETVCVEQEHLHSLSLLATA